MSAGAPQLRTGANASPEACMVQDHQRYVIRGQLKVGCRGVVIDIFYLECVKPIRRRIARSDMYTHRNSRNKMAMATSQLEPIGTAYG